MSSKQERVQLNLRLDGRKELLEAIKEAAEAADLSVNSWAIKAFESVAVWTVSACAIFNLSLSGNW